MHERLPVVVRIAEVRELPQGKTPLIPKRLGLVGGVVERDEGNQKVVAGKKESGKTIIVSSPRRDFANFTFLRFVANKRLWKTQKQRSENVFFMKS